MTTTQKVIKYIAIAFAIFLVITIISSILSGIYGLASAIGLKKDEEISIASMNTIDFENSDAAILEIDVKYTNLTIQTGEFLLAKTNNSDINCKQNNNKIQVKEKNGNWFSKNDDEELVVYIPEGLEFENVKINAGAGRINIESLNSKKLSLQLGAGETKIKSLIVKEECEIEGGAGKISIQSGEINNLDLDMGVGETKVTAELTGESKINAGIGKLDINVQANEENYKIKAEKGIGSIKINGNEISNNEVYGYGENYIKIDGGIGSIDINFN